MSKMVSLLSCFGARSAPRCCGFRVRDSQRAMGSAAGTTRGHEPCPTRDEMNGYFAVKKAYEAMSSKQQEQDAELVALADIYQKASGPCTNIEPESMATASCEVAHLLSMSDEQKLELGKAVLAAALQRELSLGAAAGTGNNYEKSFGGTKRDTQMENEYASLVRGDQGKEFPENVPPILVPTKYQNQKELARLRTAGKWFRYLGAKGCYLWIHSLTKEVTALRPQEGDIQEEGVAAQGEKKRVCDGYASYPLSGLLDAIKSVIEDSNKTPLLIDNSEEENVTAFLSYKAVLVDVSILTVGYQKSGTKVSDLMETVRIKAVAAMKAGSMLVLRLGHLTSEHANFKKKLCVRNIFPAEMFQEGGKKMFTPPRKPRCNLMFRDDDMDQGQCLVKSEGFRFCVITSLSPKEVVEKLGDTLPLGYMMPVTIVS